jgi:hypothetical protein
MFPRTARRTTALPIAVLLAACGCGGPAPLTPDDGGGAPRDAGAHDAGSQRDTGVDSGFTEEAPIFRNSVSMPDEELAREALRLMGAPAAGGSGSCNTCHGITRESVAHFRELSDAAWSTCFADLEVETPEAAGDVLECFTEDGRFTASKLGIYSAGAYFEWFRFVLRRARDDGWLTDPDAFVARVGMPPAGHTAWTQAEFDLVTEWFLRGTPLVDDVLSPTVVPGDCTGHVSPAMEAVVAEGALSGWTARNESASILMHGCAGAATARDCLATYPDTSTVVGAEGWNVVPGTRARVVFDTDYRSSFWTRSSADGRFVAHGGGSGSGGGSSIIDLQRRVVVGARAAYDPAFFPDNSGFMFQGTPVGAGLCEQRVLTTGSPTLITFAEAGCTSAGIALYQHVGASLDGGDYWAVNSTWSGDNGGGTTDPSIFVDEAAGITFIAMVNDGSGFEEDGTTRVTTAWEGSAVLSPSARLVVTQTSDEAGVPLGYVMRRIDVTRDGDGPRAIALPEVARYCVPGGKPAISYDDRWLVTHHRATDADAVELGFTGPGDPAFAPYRGVSNVYLVDMLTGDTTRLTNMAPGQRALFPHFRSDGWIYFMVRTAATGEHVVATDAALVLAAD